MDPAGLAEDRQIAPHVPPPDLLQRDGAAHARILFVLGLDQAEFVKPPGVVDLVAAPEPMLVFGSRRDLLGMRFNAIDRFDVRGRVADVLHVLPEGVAGRSLMGQSLARRR
jgi:hypothetical protein